MDSPNDHADKNIDAEGRPSGREISFVDLMRPVYMQRRLLWQGTAVAVGLTMLIGTIFIFRQPGRAIATVGFSPMFDASKGEYPNKLPFAPSDIVSSTVIRQAYALNNLQEYCRFEEVQGGLFVLQSSPQLRFLTLEYESRLSDSKLSSVDRQNLQSEYLERRKSIPIQYELSFLQPQTCRRIPDAVVFKTLNDVLEIWATDSERKRGVAKLNVSVLRPSIFDQIDAENLLVRADLLRTSTDRVIANIAEVEALPGAALARGGPEGASFKEVRARLEDLVQARLNPLIAYAGQGLGRESLLWVEHALRATEIRQRAAEARAEAFRVALREYSGSSALLPTPQPPADVLLQRQPDAQQLTAQIDGSFIGRIVEMSAANIPFRQEITRRAIDAAIEASVAASNVDQYRELRRSITQGGVGFSADSVSSRLVEIEAEAKKLTALFNQIYDDFSAAALRPGPALYRIDRPAVASFVRSFEPRDLFFLLLAVLIFAPLVLAVGVFAHYHARRLARSFG